MLLVILSVPVFILSVLSINIKSQFLSAGFWINTFEKANVYSQISTSVSDRLADKVVAGGGKISDITALSNLISPYNIKVFFEKNVKSILLFANGKSSEIIVFTPLPTKNIPVGTKTDEFSKFSEKMTLDDFLKNLNITGVTKEDFQIISKFGVWSWILIGTSFALLLLVLVLTYALIDAGRHLTAMGIEFALSGILILSSYFLAGFIGKYLTENFVKSANIGTSLAAIAAPPVIANVAQVWVWFALSSILLGVLLFFVKKPAKNSLR
jgi:hypothetical protein